MKRADLKEEFMRKFFPDKSIINLKNMLPKILEVSYFDFQCNDPRGMFYEFGLKHKAR